MKITTTWLESWSEPKKRPPRRIDKTVDGHQGLVVRIFPSGEVSFRFRYTFAGKRQHWLTLGRFGKGGLSLTEAFEKCLQARRELEHGLDPRDEARKREAAIIEEHSARAAAGSLADVVEQFIHRKLRAERWDSDAGAWVRDPKHKTAARKRPDAAAQMFGYPRVDASEPRRQRKGKRQPTLLSEFGELKARDITRRQLIQFFDDIVDRGAPVQANRIHALTSQLFTWAASKDLIPASQMAGIERPGGIERTRERVLSAEEIKTLWAALATANMAKPTAIALKLLLVTAQRRGELTHAKWSHFDLDERIWTIPVELLKTSHAKRLRPEPHIVPLSDLALTLLRELDAITGQGVYLLPAFADPKKNAPYSPQVLSRAVRQNGEHFGIAHFTPHDLRRTAASAMRKLGIPRLHVEKVLNHSTGDIAEVYDRHDYLVEKKAALERWGKHVHSLIREQ